MTARRLLGLLCVCVCATALVGCGGDTFALDPVASAANTTAETESARIAFSATMNAGNLGNMSFQGRGIYDGRSKTGWMNMTFSLPPQAQAQVSGKPSMEMIFDGSDGFVMYMRTSAVPGMPTDKWLKMDLVKLADNAGVDLGALMNANQADPNQSLRMLMASTGARPTGSERIRGVRTTRYAFRVDLKRLADDNEALRESLEKVIDMVGVDTYPAQAWIDAQGRVRRMKVTMSFGAQFGTPISMTLTEDLYDFGVRATIFPPPDDQVVDLSSFVSG